MEYKLIRRYVSKLCGRGHLSLLGSSLNSQEALAQLVYTFLFGEAVEPHRVILLCAFHDFQFSEASESIHNYKARASHKEYADVLVIALPETLRSFGTISIYGLNVIVLSLTVLHVFVDLLQEYE